MADRVLRDHSQRCDHGFTGYHGMFQGDGESSCPGGREVTIDYEAAWGYLRSESARPIDSDELVWIDKVDMLAAFDAALDV